MVRHIASDNFDGTITVKGECPLSGKAWSLTVQVDQYDAWVNGALIQNAFPTLTAGQRELLISGICPEAWTETFGED